MERIPSHGMYGYRVAIPEFHNVFIEIIAAYREYGDWFVCINFDGQILHTGDGLPDRCSYKDCVNFVQEFMQQFKTKKGKTK